MAQKGCFAMARILAVLFALVLAPAAFAQEPAFRMPEKPGPHAVGLKVVEQVDKSRTFQVKAGDTASQPRPLQTLVWYPASTGGKPMTYGDYATLQYTETDFRHRLTPEETGKIAALPDATRTQAMLAQRDAKPAPGKFPVIIYAASFSSLSWENADLCEYLASHGYVVIATPGMGVHRDATNDVAGTNAQAGDITFLLDYAKALPNADTAHVAAVGYSWGALASLFAAARDPRIQALVALDGSQRYFPGVVKDAGDVHPETMRLPMMFFFSQYTIEDEAAIAEKMHASGPSVLNAWKAGDFYGIDMLGLVHPQFSARGQRNDKFYAGEFASMQHADYDRQDGVAAYGWIARYTRAFLDAYLKQDSDAKDFLKKTPAQNGVPAHLMGARFRAAKAAP